MPPRHIPLPRQLALYIPRCAQRSGRREELLSGPLLYGLVHSLLTVVFFTASPAGAIAVAVLCWGDGAAELAGRSYGVARLPHSPGKAGGVRGVMQGVGGRVAGRDGCRIFERRV